MLITDGIRLSEATVEKAMEWVGRGKSIGVNG
jgi:hypothetical protein